MIGRMEQWLDRERDQLALWLPVALGVGIAGWFTIPTRDGWIAFILALLSAAVAAAFIPSGRLRRAGTLFPVLAVLGCMLIWWRAEHVDGSRLDRPRVATFTAKIEAVEHLAARDLVRLTLLPDPGQSLPKRVRVNVDIDKAPAEIEPGSRVSLTARLMPPGVAALPGAYDFARVAWFRELGATGTATGKITLTEHMPATGFSAQINGIRAHLTDHIQRSVSGSAGGIAAALVTGDQGGIAEADVEAMRNSGLAHLLSISGLHVGAVVAGAMLLMLRMLALSPRLALRAPLPVIAAGVAAAVGIFYTLLAGAEIPTVRSCIAALLILTALAMGREAVTLKLVAAGAMVVLLLWPEAWVSPSFQLSFAAVTALVAFHEYPRVRAFGARREGEGWVQRGGRSLLILLLTGLAVETALTPIALYHFHRAGIYGLLANMIAIPLTTFIIMPIEAIALLLDAIGLGYPFWTILEISINILINIASYSASMPGSVSALPAMTTGAFALMIMAGLWICLWRGRPRWFAIPIFAAGAAWAVLTPSPDLLITSDGRHVALRDPGGGLFLLRPKAGDFTRETLRTVSAEEERGSLDAMPAARCSADLCVADIEAGSRHWRLLATRSPYFVPWRAMTQACAEADIVVSDRRLPRGCNPRWLKIDRSSLARTGGLAIRFDPPSIRKVHAERDEHPWMMISPASYPR